MKMFANIIEAILFAADGPLTIEQISFGLPGASVDEIRAALEALRDSLDSEERGFRLAEIADGWQLASDPDLYNHVKRFLEGKRRARLSRAALEAVSVIAYKQPITRGELEEMRSVDCGGVLHTLLERDLITVRGRSPALGRPLIYGTTERFLEHFGLASLATLPKLEEIESLWASEEVRAQLEAEAERRFGPQVVAPEKDGDADPSSEPGPGGNGDRDAVDTGVPQPTTEEKRDPISDTLPEG